MINPTKSLILLIAVMMVSVCNAQKSVTGYWYGQANVEVSGIQNNYLTELIIAQKGNKVKGFFGYYFKDVYQSFVVNGTYDPATRQITISDIPIIYYMTNSTANSVDCITTFKGTLRVSKVKSELSGYFIRDKKYTYTCPDLRVNYTLFNEAKVEDSIFKDMVTTRTFWKPQTAVSQVGAEDVAAEEEMKRLEDKKAAAAPVVAATEEKKTPPPVAVPPPAVAPDIARINNEFKKRKQILNKQFDVSSDSVRLSFYDNGEVDGDSISVFMNGNLVVVHQRLTERAFNVYVKLDPTKDVNEVTMFAENLGKYPPNTALMVMSDGENRFETYLSSDLKGNAVVRLKRKTTGAPTAAQ